MERPESERFASGVSRPMAFFKGFLRRPRDVGSVVPSSPYLSRRIADAVRGAHVVAELGPGTGPITHALLGVLPAQARLLAIELDPDFAALLEAERDRRLVVHRGNASELAQALTRHGMQHADAVVSGIPFSTMGEAAGRRVLQQVWDVLRPGGTFVAYQFRGEVARLALDIMGRPRMALELRNVPPIRIYSWRKPGA
jgi:phospholipid N-methyltransferase